MEGQPKCKKCGRVLKSPGSVARGMGSKCAGITAATGRTFHSRYMQDSGKTYQADGASGRQVTLFPGDLSTKRLGKREVFRRIKEERHRLFLERKPFQCSVLSRTRTPLVYVPAGDGDWKESHSGRIIPHKKLHDYLKQYQLI